MADEPKPKGNGHPPERVIFEYIKSPLFRVIHADGVVGSPTPSGNLHMAFFSERPAIPKRIAHALNEDKSLGAVVSGETVVREGLIREIDVDVIMSVQVAENLLKWLADRVADLKARAESQ